ncbi:MAG: hypothetical protein A2041_08310 [Bacteroidetes bacterium GWA2_31_9b]|nr:MAG: hypothetical protein A2041_08310 [Bacteroidetes bacterium GWA2_31_9b]
MKSAYLIAGMRLSIFLKLIWENGISLTPKYLVRFLFLLQNGFWASIFYRKEKKIYEQKIIVQKLSTNPVIIIGHWRTGSTYLHQLLSLDPNFVTSNVFQASIPDSFLTSRKSYEPIMQRFVKGTRPMDQVKLGLDEPLEDEYALFRLTSYSPLKHLIFPKSDTYFLKLEPDFLPTDNKLEEWKNALKLFYKKLLIFNKKTILIKNPFHSYRLNLLNEIFPDSKYIHIIRHPYQVVPSTQRMWDIVGSQNSLNKNWCKPKLNEVAEEMIKMMQKIDADKKKLTENRFIEIKFEDFEKDPIQTIKAIYNQFGIIYTEGFQKQIENFIFSIKDYKKNDYILPLEDKKAISEIMKSWMTKYEYSFN